MGFLSGSSAPVAPTAAPPRPAWYLRYSTSLEGRVKAIGWGRSRVAVNCIWYAGFRSTAVTTSSSTGADTGGGKGGLFGGSSAAPATTTSTKYIYHVDVIFSIGDGPIAGVGNRYKDRAVGAGIYKNGTVVPGTYTQGVWSQLTAAYPSQALAYRGEALFVIAGMSLGSSTSLPNVSLEVVWGVNNGGSDANPADVVADFLANPGYGVPGWDASLTGDYSAYRTYCGALGLLVSPVLSSQVQAASFLADLLKATNSEAFWSSGVLNIAPYADADETANGFAYKAATTPVYDLTVDDLMENQGSLGTGTVAISRKPRAEIFNRMRTEFLDRANNYNPSTVESSDEASVIAYGDRPSELVQDHAYALRSAATRSCALRLAREQVALTFQFTVPEKFILLDPMDVVTLTEPSQGLVHQPVRITAIDENDDGSLTLTADEMSGVVAAPLYERQLSAGAQSDFNADPGAINPPTIFEPPYQLAGGLEVWIAVSGQAMDIWGGCNVFVSNDDVSYARAGTIYGAARMGAATAALPAIAPALTGQTIDTANVLSVDLAQSRGALIPASQSDMVSASTAMLVDGEIVAYQNAALKGASAYDLSPLLRGAFATPIAAHAAGAPVVRLDDGVFRYAYTPDRIGQTIYLKFQSFNIYEGAAEDLAAIGSTTYTISGAPLAAPLATPQNLRTVYSAGFQELAFDEVTDFRQDVRYKVYRGDSPAVAQLVGDVAHPPFKIPGAGTYFVVAYAKPISGFTVRSAASAPITIVGNMLVANPLVIEDQVASNWKGTRAGLTIQGTAPSRYLALAAGAMTGTYQVPASDIVDLGYTGVLALNVTSKAVGVPVGQSVFDVADFLGQADIFGSGASQYVDSFVEVQIGVPGTSADLYGVADVYAMSDVYAAPIAWGAWQKFAPGNYQGRYANFRINVTTSNPQATAYILSFTIQASVPTRIDHYQNLAVPADGLTITFKPDGAVAAARFNGGPNAAALPYVNIAAAASQPGDYLTFGALTLGSVKIQVFNGGTGVARTGVNVDVQGY